MTDASGRKARILAQGGGPTVSPDGRWITFWRSFTGPFGDPLYLLDRRTGETRIVGRHVYGPVLWKQDSREIILRVAAGSPFPIRIESVDPINLRRHVIVSGKIGDGMSVSPDGQWIAYDAIVGESPYYPTDLFAVPIGDGKPRRLTSDGLSSNPVWGPDIIAYQRMTKSDTWPTEVWGLRLGERETRPRRLGISVRSFTPGGHWEPIAWWPDGRHLIIGVNPDQHGFLAFYDLNVNTSRMRKIVESKGPMTSAKLSRSGRAALISYGSGFTAIVSTSSGRILRRVGAGDSAVWNR
jgi:Tol biopolymer transport system component